MTEEIYLSAFGEVLLFIIAGILFIVITLFLSKAIRPNRPNAQKLETYESGEQPVSAAWIQFNIRFYIIALIFLIFEVEIVLLFPWSTVFADKNLILETGGTWGWIALIEAILFIVILAIGLAYAWVNGFLDWIKPEEKSSSYKSPVPTTLYDKVNERFRKK